MSVKSQNAKKFVILQTMICFTELSTFISSPKHYCHNHHRLILLYWCPGFVGSRWGSWGTSSIICPFVFHSGINCPVVSCGFSSFKTKKSYSRHSETRQKPHHVIIYSSIPRCKSTCRRKTDMQYHLRSIHHLNYCCFELNNIVRYFFSTKHILNSIIILFFFRMLTSHRL